MDKVKQNPEDLKEVLSSLKTSIKEIAKPDLMKNSEDKSKLPKMITKLLKEIKPLILENEKRIEKKGRFRLI